MNTKFIFQHKKALNFVKLMRDYVKHYVFADNQAHTTRSTKTSQMTHFNILH